MERRRSENERRRNLIVGLTALVGLLGLVLLLAAFGYVPALLRGGYTVTVYLDDIAGLRENSRVTLWGQEIGEIKEVGFSEPGAPEKTYVVMLIDDAFEIPEDVSVRVETPLFGGGPMVALVGSAPGSPTLATDGTAQLSTARVVDPLMQLESVSEQFTVLSRDITELKNTWSAVGENVNTLFGTPEDQDQPSLARVVLGLEDRLDQMQRVMTEAEQWLDNDQLREDVTKTAANARELTESLSESVASLEKRYVALADSAEARLNQVDQTLTAANRTLDTASNSIAEIETTYVKLADDAAKVVAVIDKLVARADSDESTIGLLLRDPQLAKNLADTSERIKLLTDEARLLIEKWKAEGIPLRIFD